MEKGEIRDQAAHAAIVAAALLPVALWPGILTFAWAGLGYGLMREFTEWQDKRKHGSTGGKPWSPGSLRDLAAYTTTGLLIGLLLRIF